MTIRRDHDPAASRVKPGLLVAGCLVGGLLAITDAGPAAAQQPRPGAPQQPVPADMNREWLIAAAVLAVPENLREGAEVRAWTADEELVVLRAGTNDIICLADPRSADSFAAACYHTSLEPFMKRGRELRREGIEGARRDQIRWQEIKDGTLPMPAMAMVYNLRFPTAHFDPAETDPATGSRLHALYVPGATTESTGVSALPSDEPWLMLPGTPSAHVMITLPRKEP